jgi:hypothetical protein
MRGTRGRRYLVPLMSVALSLIVAVNLQAATNFFDNAWPPATLWVDTTITATGGSTFTTTTVPSGGVGNGPYRQTTNNYFGSSAIVAAHTAPLFASYVPSMTGAITSIDFSFYGKSFNGPQVGYWLLIVQNSTYYRIGPPDIVVANSWTSFSNPGLTAGSFTVLSGPGPAQPDFSCTGSMIQFGFVTGNSNPSGNSSTPITTTSGIDNWSVTVNSDTPCCTLTGNIVSGCCLGQVPCPGSATQSDFYSFLASVTFAGSAACNLTVTSSTSGVVIESLGPATLTTGANFVTGTFAAPQTSGNYSLTFSCSGAGGLRCSTTLTAAPPCCPASCPWQPASRRSG